MAEEDQLTAPYGSFETTKNALQGFLQGVPPRIDRSAFPGLAWNATSRLINGLRFMGLIDADGRPQPSLHSLAVPDEETRKAALASVLRASYPAVFALDLARVTPAHLAEVLGEAYDVSGDTREKAVRFFVSAAMYAGIPMSPLLVRERGRKPGGVTRRLRPASTKPRATDRPAAVPPASGATRTIQLQSGGTLTVTAAVDFLTLSAADRTFVFDVIDKLTTYESEHDDGEED